MPDLRFVIGGRYENRKGVFLVKEISGDSMLIEWETGEKIYTTIRRQSDIIRNMELDWELENAKKSENRTFRVPVSYGTKFTGLKNDDFKTNVAGTHWRSREQLGGAVAKAFLTETALMDSWATYREPSVQWADKKKYSAEKAWVQAKFWASLDASGMTFGFYIERDPRLSETRKHWENWINWIKGKDEWLRQAAIEKNLEFFPLGASLNEFKEWLFPNEQGWSSDLNKDSNALSAYDAFSKFPGAQWIGVVLGKRFAKDYVVSRGAGIADEIADVFNKLMPMYEACIFKNL